MTTRTALTVAALSIFVRAAEPSDELQGKWEGLEKGRESLGKCTMTIAGDTIRFDGPGKVEWYSAKFALPSDQTPKQLHATITDCPEPKFVGKLSLAIYKIEDGTLTMVGHKPGAPDVPKDFNGGEAARTFVFKKAEIAK